MNKKTYVKSNLNVIVECYWKFCYVTCLRSRLKINLFPRALNKSHSIIPHDAHFASTSHYTSSFTKRKYVCSIKSVTHDIWS